MKQVEKWRQNVTSTSVYLVKAREEHMQGISVVKQF